MPKKLTALFLALLLGLTACGKVVPVEGSSAPEAPAPAAGAEAGEETPAAQEAEPAPAQAEPEPSQPAPAAPAQPAEQSQFRPGAHLEWVENNGSEFVYVMGSVYHREYGPDTLLHTALFGEFLDNPNVDGGGESRICCGLKTLFTTPGWGPLYYGNGGFYLQEPGDGQPLVCWYSMDGSERREIGPGTILGISEGGDLLAVQTYSWETGTTVTLYRNGEENAVLRPGNLGFVYAGLTDAGLFFLEKNYDSGELRFCQLAADGSTEPIVLGLIPAPDYPAAPNVDDFAVAGGKAGVIVGFYAGTAYDLNDYAAVQARVGTAGSLSLLYESAGNDYLDFTPRLQPDDTGTFHLVEHLPGELWIDENGGLRYWTEQGTEALLWAHAEQRRESGRGFARLVQAAEWTRSDVYLLTADCFYSPEDSVGWRDGYRLLGLSAWRIPIRTEALFSIEEAKELYYTDCEAEFSGLARFVVDALPEPPEESEEKEEDPETAARIDAEQEEAEPAPAKLPVPTAILFAPFAEEGELWEPTYGFAVDFAPAMRFRAADFADLTEAAAVCPVVLTEEPGYEGYSFPEDEPALPVRFTLDREGRIVELEVMEG